MTEERKEADQALFKCVDYDLTINQLREIGMARRSEHKE
jgi:phage anti-repressor protein